jgi:sterol desaturase/sphingolipid hydroxylase (fatty acid hydroxylase superfamily)
MLDDAYDALIGGMFEHGVQPALFALGLMGWADDAQHWLGFALFGLIAVLLSWALCGPLEAWRPVERMTDSRAVRTDILYTLLIRVGILPLVAFVLLSAADRQWQGILADWGVLPPTIEELIPALREQPLLTFMVYVVVLDFAEYWRHRFQHAFGWWWALHAVHHAQRQMTFWTDDRNHLLDEALAGLWFAGVALLIGVPPTQFPLLLLILRVAESLSHANVRLSFGRIGERLLVSPRFHRLHHGELSTGQNGKNYAVLLPVWDWIFGTADFRRDVYPRTGDPQAPEALATGGWFEQQVVALRWMMAQLRGGPVREGTRPPE